MRGQTRCGRSLATSADITEAIGTGYATGDLQVHCETYAIAAKSRATARIRAADVRVEQYRPHIPDMSRGRLRPGAIEPIT